MNFPAKKFEYLKLLHTLIIEGYLSNHEFEK